ncbi:MAG: MoxR family ATPase [Gemmatimonadota bacterium]|nr:MoxR family ATPase [Gemmatimonadota bacterium]
MPDYSIDSLQAAFAAERYVADRDLATALFLSLSLERPLLLEGEAGVGKTEVARTLAKVLDTRLVRLQCYEGLDVSTAVYEWDYPRQMLEIRLLEARGEAGSASSKDIFSEAFLIRRPILAALESPGDRAPVLLIDEIDRADEEFEAFLLEVLSDFAVTIPEIGTLRAKRPPHVIVTSNRTREVHDALKRRCLYHWIDYPSAERELAILETRMPDLPAALARDVVAFVQRLRTVDLSKVPGIAETIDWAAALVALGARRLDTERIDQSLGALLKYQEDIAAIRGEGARSLLETARTEARTAKSKRA